MVTNESWTPGERLRAWADSQEPPIPMVALAELLEVSRPHLSNVIAGRERPSLALAARIERLTGLPCLDWSAAPTTASEAETAELPVTR